MAVRKDTITLNFERDLLRRPLSGELCRWMKEEIGVSVQDLRSVEYEFGSMRIFLKFKSGEKIDGILEKNNGERKMKLDNGEVTKVMLTSNGHGIKTVRVKNLPSEICDSELRKVLSEYGQVGPIEHEKYGPKSYFAGLLTGVRIVRATLQKNVPSYIKVGGEEAYVTYFGQAETCHSCGQIGHKRAGCPTKKQRRSTYAGRLAARTPLGEVSEPATPLIDFNSRKRSGAGLNESEQEVEQREQSGKKREEKNEQEERREWEAEREKAKEGMFLWDLDSTIMEDLGGLLSPEQNKKNEHGLTLDIAAAQIPRTESDLSQGKDSSAAADHGTSQSQTTGYDLVSEKSDFVVGAGEAAYRGTWTPDTPGTTAVKKIKCLFDNALLCDPPPPPSPGPNGQSAAGGAVSETTVGVAAPPPPPQVAPLTQPPQVSGPGPQSQLGADPLPPCPPADDGPQPLAQCTSTNTQAGPQAAETSTRTSSRPSTPRTQPSTPSRIPGAPFASSSTAAARAAAKAAAVASKGVAMFAAKSEGAKNKRALETSPEGQVKEGKTSKKKGKNNKK